jgi:hypothetical protein
MFRVRLEQYKSNPNVKIRENPKPSKRNSQALLQVHVKKNQQKDLQVLRSPRDQWKHFFYKPCTSD